MQSLVELGRARLSGEWCWAAWWLEHNWRWGGATRAKPQLSPLSALVLVHVSYLDGKGNLAPQGSGKAAVGSGPLVKLSSRRS